MKAHKFLDEAGDTTFYGKGRIPILGTDLVSNVFILGSLTINEPVNGVRNKVVELQNEIVSDLYFKNIPSILKKKERHGYFLHAKDDIPEVRKMAFDLIKSIDCTFECIVARKSYEIYEKKHNGKEAEFYADLLSHLLKNKISEDEKLVLNIAERSKCTTNQNLNNGLLKAFERANRNNYSESKISFNVQNPTTEPILNLTDYFCWAIQRLFERGETRYYDFLVNQISQVIDIYDLEKSTSGNNIYSIKNKLSSENKVYKKSP
jgi:hypothetical protein